MLKGSAGGAKAGQEDALTLGDLPPEGCPGCGAPTYGADKACPCNCDGNCDASVNPAWYKGLPAGNADPKVFPVSLLPSLPPSSSLPSADR